MKSGYLGELTDAAIASLIEGAAPLTSPFNIVECQPLGGAVAKYGPDHSAFGNRDAQYLFNILSLWEDPALDDDQIAWTRDFYNKMDQHSTGGVYVNYLTADEGPGRVRAAYGEDRYQRLMTVKTKYDPDNVFHLNQNLNPAAKVSVPTG